MGAHSLPDDHPAQPDDRIEVKVLVSSAVTLLAGVLVALCNAVLADSSVLGGLPAWAQFAILAAAPAVLAFAAGYAKTSNRVPH